MRRPVGLAIGTRQLFGAQTGGGDGVGDGERVEIGSSERYRANRSGGEDRRRQLVQNCSETDVPMREWELVWSGQPEQPTLPALADKLKIGRAVCTYTISQD